MAIKSKEIERSTVLRLEHEINNLWGELNTSTISHQLRLELEGKLSGCEQQFRAVLGGTASIKELEGHLHEIDLELTKGMLQQGEAEIPKIEKTSVVFQALENIHHQLEEGRITPQKARHEIKDVLRHHRS